MKTKLMALSLLLLLARAFPASGGTAQIHIANNSIKLFPGPCTCGFGLYWYLHFSSQYTEDPLQTNGELAPRAPGSPTTHWAYMMLEDPSMFTGVTWAEMNLPMGDLNDDGIADFFERSTEVSSGSTGSYQSDLLGGTLSFSWSRAAGSTYGGCVLYMDDRMLGRQGPFVHQFEILQHSGNLNYQRSGSACSGSVDLQQGFWRGPVQLGRSTSDPYNTLTLQAGTWTNASETFSFEEAILKRSSTQPSTYIGALQSSSGIFRTWTIWIVDSSDSDGDGIPDLSDDLAPSARPTLELRKQGNTWDLLISGNLGRTHEIQNTTSLNAPSWQTTSSVILTNNPQAVPITPPLNGAKFWRVEAK